MGDNNQAVEGLTKQASTWAYSIQQASGEYNKKPTRMWQPEDIRHVDYSTSRLLTNMLVLYNDGKITLDAFQPLTGQYLRSPYDVCKAIGNISGIGCRPPGRRNVWGSSEGHEYRVSMLDDDHLQAAKDAVNFDVPKDQSPDKAGEPDGHRLRVVGGKDNGRDGGFGVA